MITTNTPITPENRAELSKYPVELVEMARDRLGHIYNSCIFLEQNPVVKAGLSNEMHAEALRAEQLAVENSPTDELNGLKQFHMGESAVSDSHMDDIRQQIKEIYDQKTN